MTQETSRKFTMTTVFNLSTYSPKSINTLIFLFGGNRMRSEMRSKFYTSDVDYSASKKKRGKKSFLSIVA